MFNDPEIAAQILKASSPRRQKALSREISGYDEAKWLKARIGIVRRGNFLKFLQCTNATSLKMNDEGGPVPLKDLLLTTKGRELAEASPFDRVWGNRVQGGRCFCSCEIEMG